MTACPNRGKATILPPGSKPAPAAIWIREGALRRRVPRGAFLFRPGDAADPLYIVEEGLVKVSISSKSGRDLTVGLYGPGEVFGEEAVLEGATRYAFAASLEPTVLVSVPRARVRLLVERDREVAFFLTRLFAARLRDAVQQMEDLAWSPVPARLATMLLRLARRNGWNESAVDGASVRITHQELANLIGSTRETTTATLNEFRRRGWLTIAHRQIVLLRPDLLASALPESA